MADHQPIEPKYTEAMNRLAPMIDKFFNGEDKRGDRKVGFFLGVFNFDDHKGDGRFNYISNADQRDIIVLLKEMTAKFEGQPDIKGRG